MSFRVVVLYLCGLALLGGCTTAVVGEPLESVEVRKQRTPLSAAEALGEFATVDYCSLLGARSLRDGAGSFEGKSRREITHCVVPVKNDNARAWVLLGWLTKLESVPSGGRRMARELRVLPGSQGSDHCRSLVAFSDKYAIAIAAHWDKRGDLPVGKRRRALCSFADAVAESVAENLLAGNVNHLRELAPTSFVRRDLCEVVPLRQLRRAGIRATETKPVPDGHSCHWFGDRWGEVAMAYLGLTDWTGRYTRLSIAGRPSVLERWEDEDAAGCTITTRYAVFPVQTADEEMLNLTVYRMGAGDPCRTVKRFARVVWPTLPEVE